MHIEKITISNFKGFQNAEFVPSRFSCLVGENNAGKSTILQSIVTALNRPARISPELFYDKLLPVIFKIELRGITAEHLLRLATEHRARISNLILDGRFVLVVSIVSAKREYSRTRAETFGDFHL
jgi:predicted ATP-dependent endonuclease of OLD family